MSELGLRHHGDAELAEGLVDLAVNVRRAGPPDWLARALADCVADLARYPDTVAARRAVAERHRVAPANVLLTAGAAEAFTLLANVVRPRCAVVVHPQFTEPEVALRAAGHAVHRVLLSEQDGFRLDPGLVPAHADLVLLGNPTNPTSVLHPAELLRSLARPGRLLVVDEAFADTVPGEPESLAGQAVPGVLVVRSLTKMWGIAGLRAGYLLGEEPTVRALRAVQPPWSVSTFAAVATVACSSPAACAEADALAVAGQAQLRHLTAGLRALGVPVPGVPRAPFVLARLPPGTRELLRTRGYAVRRGDTFPGLTSEHLRITARDAATTDAFLRTLATLTPAPAAPPSSPPPRMPRARPR